ncbi:MAG: response regulator [Oligoflexia bacterium]|nr:response regulator [Oligoflexia bacterium]MBF0365126.1 response regulator [Oligoflexia bacterium]
MKIIFFVDDEKLIRELGTLELEGMLDVQVVEIASSDDAVAYLKKNPDVDLIISDYSTPKGNGGNIYEQVKQFSQNSGNKTIPFVLFTSMGLEEVNKLDGFASDSNNAYIQKPGDLKNLTKTVQKLLHNQVTSDPTSEESPYCKVGIKNFLKFNSSSCDIFIKLSQKKFLKVINQNDSFDFEQIEKYANKGLSFFYVKRADFHAFSEHYSQLLRASLQDSNLSTEDRIEKEVEGMQFLQETILAFGINQTVIDTTNLLAESTEKIVKNNPDILKLLSIMMANKNYIYEHSLMMAYFASMIATEMNWSTSATLQKIVTACLMHDLLLDDPELAKVDILGEDMLQTNTFTRKQFDAIQKHPGDMALKMKRIQNFPSDIEQMVMDHHERFDGRGFPRGLTPDRITPMTSILIVAEEFVNEIYKKAINSNSIYKVAEGLKTKYNHVNFKKTIEGFLKVIQKIKLGTA